MPLGDWSVGEGQCIFQALIGKRFHKALLSTMPGLLVCHPEALSTTHLHNNQKTWQEASFSTYALRDQITMYWAAPSRSQYSAMPMPGALTTLGKSTKHLTRHLQHVT